MRRICRIFAVVAALAVPGSAAAQAPLLAVATNWSPWLDPHVFAYAPGASLRALAPGIAGVASPDGTRLAFVRDGRLWVSAANGADAHPLAGVPAAEPVAGSLAWSPDGARVGYVAYGESVVLADPDSGAATTIARATAFAWSPEDSRVVYATAEPTPRLVVARTDGSDTRTLAAFDSVTGLAWSRSGTIAVAGVHGPAGVWLVDAATGAVRGLDLRVRASSPAWSPDGTSLAYLRSARGIPRTVVVARGGRSRALGTLSGNAVGDVAWSADGRRLAAAASGALLVGSPRAHAHAYRLPPAARLADPGVAVSWLGRSLVVSGRADPERADTELALVRADGSGYRVLTHDGVDERDPDWSPDGRTIVYARLGGLWTIRANGTHARRLVRAEDAQAPAYSPDGRLIAYVAGGAIRIVDGGGAHRRLLVHVRLAPRQLSWTPDGRSVVYGDAYGIERVDAATGAVSPIDVGGGDLFRPVVGPGGRLAFEAYRDERYYRDPSAWGVWTSDLSGGSQRKILVGKIGPSSWSPDGALLALCDGARVEIVGADGSGPTTLFDAGRSFRPVFAPSA